MTCFTSNTDAAVHSWLVNFFHTKLQSHYLCVLTATSIYVDPGKHSVMVSTVYMKIRYYRSQCLTEMLELLSVLYGNFSEGPVVGLDLLIKLKEINPVLENSWYWPKNSHIIFVHFVGIAVVSSSFILYYILVLRLTLYKKSFLDYKAP